MNHSRLSFIVLIGLLVFPMFVLASTVEVPLFSHTTGTYNTPVTVTMTCATTGATIYYTTDGSEPTTESLQYDGTPILAWKHASGNALTGESDNDPDPNDENDPLTSTSLTLKAMAVKEGMEASALAEAVYVVDLVDASLNIPYDDPPEAGGSKHWLDIYQPAGKTDTPVLVFVHGGAWKQGDKNIYLELGNTYAGYYGLTTVIVNYQLSSDPWNVKHPTHVEDVAKAFAWVRENIESYGGDADHISLFGQSAGAHLISLLATDISYLDAFGLWYNNIEQVIPMSGAYNLGDFVQWPLNPLDLSALEVAEYKTLFFTAFGSWDEDVLKGGSPGEFINADQPPFHLIALNETDTFKDMPGFGADADQFRDQILNLNGPVVTLERLSESDIDETILELEFSPNASTDGHYEEIYAINTPLWNSVSSQMVAGYVGNRPDVPALISPESDSEWSNEILFTWSACEAAIYYELEIATSETFGEEDIVWSGQIGETSWSVPGLDEQGDYFWRVRAVNGLGASNWSETSQFTFGETSEVSVIEFLPSSFDVQAYPNPFNGALMLQISVPENVKEPGHLMIYNLQGRLVENRTLELHQGVQTVRWQPDSNVTSGVYLFRIDAGKFSSCKRALYVK